MIIRNVAHLRKEATSFGAYRTIEEDPGSILLQIKEKEGEIREFIKSTNDYFTKNFVLGISANQLHSDLPIISFIENKEVLYMINPHLNWWQKKFIASVEELDEVPMVRCIVPRSDSIRVKYFTLKDNKFTIEETRFKGNKSVNVQRLLDLLSGKICFDKALAEPNASYSQIEHESLVYKVDSSTYKHDYFVEGINQLFFSGLLVSPNDYKEKKVVGVSKIKLQ